MDKINLSIIEGLNTGINPLPPNLWSPNFFPSHKFYFVVLADDDVTFFCSREKLNGKGIYSAQEGKSSADYFKSRLGVPKNEMITIRDLIAYGRTEVDFYKDDEESFYMDFSVQVNG